jgi:chromate reductase, NAD(P)H dehydrogenase (quinone)
VNFTCTGEILAATYYIRNSFEAAVVVKINIALSMSSKRLKILAISGSLRKNSSSTLILHHAGSILSKTCDVEYFDGIGQLPHFDDAKIIPPIVNDFRNKIMACDGVIISQPEYAFVVAGSLKNALDWTVGSGEFNGKPVSLITAATGGENAHEAMLKTLRAIDCQLSADNLLLISFVKSKFDQQGNIKDESLTIRLDSLSSNFVMQVRNAKIASI